jgi:hypothetical protein
MGHRRLFKQKQRQRISIRNVLVVTAVTSTFLIAGITAFFYTLDTENSDASILDEMVLTDLNVSHPNESHFRGMSNAAVLKININTTGRNTPLNVKELTFSLRGTSVPFNAQIKNLKAWYTGNSQYFNPLNSYGSSLSISDISDDHFEISGSQLLSEGANYFWLTFDYNSPIKTGPTFLDAELIKVKLGSLDYRPNLASPHGNIELIEKEVWYAIADGDISDISNWNTKRDGSGENLKNPNDSNSVYIIPPGRKMTNDLGSSIPLLVIENGSRLFSSTRLKSHQVIVQANGILRIDEALGINDIPAMIEVNPLGTYIHNNDGSIPPTLRCKKGSTIWITHQPTLSFMSGKFNVSNLIMDFNTKGSYNLSQITNLITGDLEIRRSNTSGYIYYAANNKLSIGGDLILSGGNFACTYGDFKSTITINGNLICNSGKLINNVTPGRNGTSTLVLKGNAFINKTNIDLARRNSVPTRIILSGENMKWHQTGDQANLGNITLSSKSTLKLSGNYLGRIAESCSFEIVNNAFIDCGKTRIIGNGSFVVKEFAKLGFGHPSGIASQGNTGNIQTQIRDFSSKSILIYNGTDAIQKTGVFSTTPLTNHVNELTVHLRNSNGMLVLDQDLSLSSRLNIISGYLVRNEFDILENDQRTTSVK